MKRRVVPSFRPAGMMHSVLFQFDFGWIAGVPPAVLPFLNTGRPRYDSA